MERFYTLRSLQALLLVFASGWTAVAAEPPIVAVQSNAVRVERITVPGGGELYTFFRKVAEPSGSAQASETPLVGILRDTLGDDDPTNDRLRDVWAFTYSRPSPVRHLAAATPFLYHRPGWPGPGRGVASSLIDLAAPAQGTFSRVSLGLIQSAVLDPLGMPFRAITRAYHTRSREYKDLHLWAALETINAEAGAVGGFTEPQLNLVRGRMLLAQKPLGGLVDDRYAAPAWTKFETTAAERRARNWELLRQRAEENGLYFEPVNLTRTGQTFALLWMDQSKAGEVQQHFDSKFLGIADPYRDPRILQWKDYTEIWRLDEHGAVIRTGVGPAREARMIPLALYALEHPKAPLMLVDFRDPGKPRRREIVRRATSDVATGVLGWTGFGNWTWLAARTSYSFIRSRHGSPLDRTARVRALVQVRQALEADQQLNPALRASLAGKLDKLGLNPFDSSSRDELETARRQYETLLERVRTGRLAEHLERERQHEVESVLHNASGRAVRKTGTLLSLGIYRHKHLATPVLLAAVDRERRIAFHRKFLEQALAASPAPDITTDADSLQRSVSALGALVTPEHRAYSRTAVLISWVMSSVSDPRTREVCVSSLARMSSGEPKAAPSVATNPEPLRTTNTGSQ